MKEDKKLYYVTKQGIYCQGIFYIGFDREEAIKKAKLFAKLDTDNYHFWNVYEDKLGDIAYDSDSYIFSVNKVSD